MMGHGNSKLSVLLAFAFAGAGCASDDTGAGYGPVMASDPPSMPAAAPPPAPTAPTTTPVTPSPPTPVVPPTSTPAASGEPMAGNSAGPPAVPPEDSTVPPTAPMPPTPMGNGGGGGFMLPGGPGGIFGMGGEGGAGSEDPPTPANPSEAGSNEPIIPEPSGSCPDFRTGTMQIGGLSVNVEAGSPGATPGPLLFAWHGTGGTGGLAMIQVPASVKREITSQGGIVIAPSSNGQAREGADVTFVLGVWYDGADLDLADQVVACAVQNHNIDPRKIYATGCSAGGLMTGVMSVKRSNYVAAAAPNSGGVAVPIGLALQSPDRMPAVMTMHGGSGDNVIVNFQDTSNNLIGFLKPKGAFMVDCNHNRGHCGAPTGLHENAWTFMKAHTFGADSPYAGGLPADFPSYCEIQ